ncbi:tape measure protein [Pseudomonas sp. MM211]|uniref:tape measure protein n=1 Tax=Pseudomonas sp. MM211 TaxID=2866808 RepID=UPI001CECB237|nr:tape measure protein [Pseudomonas sp. MM211]UCJ18916.1 tape measure protein [Pseudomonas sp. MM211]
MDNINRKMRELEKQATRLERKLGMAPKGSANVQKQLQQQQRLTQAQFQQMLKTSKLQLSVDQQQAKLQSLQAKAGTQQARQSQAEHRASLGRLKTEQAAQAFSLRQEQGRLKLQQEQLRTSAAASRLEATKARTQAASDRARITALRLEERINKRLPGSMRSPAGRSPTSTPSHSIWRSAGGRGFGSSLGQVASAGLGGGIGASIPGLGMFSGALHPAAIAIGALGTAAVLAQAKLNEFAKTDVAAGDTRAVERANLRVLTGGDAALAAQQEQALNKFVDDLGLLRSAIAKPYVMSAVNLTDAGLQRDQSVSLIQGIMKFARGTGTTEDDMAGALRAIGQAFSKGQLYAEEWKGQFAERIGGADKLGVQAWAAVTKSGLTGEKAKGDFAKNMSDGKITGQLMNKFFITLGQMMDDKSNLEGRLDLISQSAQSSANRITNMQAERSIRTSEFNDGALKQSSVELYQAKERLQVSLEKLIPGFSTLESASLRLETRFVDGSTRMVLWIEKLQSKINELTGDPKAIQYLDQLGAKFDQFVTHIEPLLELLTDVVTFMGSVALDKLADNFETLAERLDTAWTALEPILGEVPDAFDFLVTQLRTIIDKFFGAIGLGDRWRKHLEQRDQEDTGLSTEARIPFLDRPSPLIPTISPRMLERLATNPAQAMQQLIDSSTTNTNNVTTNQFNVAVTASGANAEEIADQLTDRFQKMAVEASRYQFDKTVAITKVNLLETKR